MQDDEHERTVGQTDKPHPLNQRTYQSIIDQQVKQAEAEGKFNNLPGQGRPQRLDDDAHVPPEDRTGYRMLQGNGFSLPWIEVRRDIDEERMRIDSWLIHANNRWEYLDEAGRTKLQNEFRKKLESLSRMVMDYNLRVPATAVQLRGVEMTRELARLGV